MSLREFEADEIVISRDDAWKILQFFFQSMNLRPNQLTEQDIAFAQALLLEAADRSYEMGYAKIMLETFLYGRPTSLDGVRDLIKEFAKKAAKHWWKNATEDDLTDAELYMSVVNKIRQNFRSVWSIRQQTGELIY